MYRISPQLNRSDWQIQNESNFIDIVSLFEAHNNALYKYVYMFIKQKSSRTTYSGIHST